MATQAEGRMRAIKACQCGHINYAQKGDYIPEAYRLDFESFCKARLGMKKNDVLTAEAWNKYIDFLKKFSKQTASNLETIWLNFLWGFLFGISVATLASFLVYSNAICK